MHPLLPYKVGVSAHPTPQTSKPDIRRYRTPKGGPQAVLAVTRSTVLVIQAIAL